MSLYYEIHGKGVATAAFGCLQPIAAIMTNEIMQDSY
jgi:hypothetical protein